MNEGRLPKERTQSKVAEALLCASKGHTSRDRSPSSSRNDQNAIEMSLGDDMVQQIVVEQFEAMQYTRDQSHKGLDHTEV